MELLALALDYLIEDILDVHRRASLLPEQRRQFCVSGDWAPFNPIYDAHVLQCKSDRTLQRMNELWAFVLPHAARAKGLKQDLTDALSGIGGDTLVIMNVLDPRRTRRELTAIPPSELTRTEGLLVAAYRTRLSNLLTSAKTLEVIIAGRGAKQLPAKKTDEYLPGSWFGKTMTGRLRKAASKNRRGKKVRKKTIDGVVCYRVSDVVKWWPDEVKMRRDNP